MSGNIGPDFRAGVSKPPHHGRVSPIPMEHYYDDGDTRERKYGKGLGTRVSWQSPHIEEVSHISCFIVFREILWRLSIFLRVFTIYLFILVSLARLKKKNKTRDKTLSTCIYSEKM